MGELGCGFEDIMTINVTNNWGTLYADQDQLKEAKAIYRQALEGKEKALRLSHSKSELIMRNIESLQRAKGIFHTYCCGSVN